MATLNSIIDECLGMARGYTRIMEQDTYITEAITNSAWTANTTGSSKVKVNDITQMSRGICEIEDELVFVDTIDQDLNTIYFAPYGRGYNSTVADTHDVYSRVVLNPIFPRSQVKEAINSTILSLRGSLYGFRTYDFSFVSAVSGYELPYDTYKVLRVEWAVPGPSKVYRRISSWRYNPNANTDTFGSGKNVEIFDPVTPGRTVHVLTSTEVQPFEYNEDDFEDTTNLPLSCKDIIVYGAVSRLLAAVDISRFDAFTMEANTLDSKSAQNSAMQTSKYLYSLFEKRKDEEIQRLLSITPIATHQEP